LDFRQHIRSEVTKQMVGLEIGPSYAPILPKAEGYRTLVIDHTDAAALRAKYAGIPGVDVARVEEVDAIDDGGEFSLLDDTGAGFDYIVASHVFEHVTDPIHFLQRCARALKPAGRLYLLVPDRRFCFDFLRPVSTAGQMLAAYLEGRRLHGPAALFDHNAYVSTRNGAIVWAETSPGVLAFAHDARQGYAAATAASRDYVDAHAWVFTPSSFRLIVEECRALGLVGLGEAFFHPSIGCEFFAVLSPAEAGRAADRMALAQSAVAEASDPAVSSMQGGATAQAPAIAVAGAAYERRPPAAQNAIDALAGLWVGRFPTAFGVEAGSVDLDDDPRILWLVERLGGSLTGLNVLELGPLEAAHTATLLAAGARSVLGVEAHRTAFLRCLVAKELRGLRDASFLLGDFMPFLEAEARTWPLIVASGVLYHMTDPLRLLELLAARTDRLFLWTHVVDPLMMPQDDPRRAAIKAREERSWRGEMVVLHHRPYGTVTDPKFCGGPYEGPRWMERSSLMRVLEVLGFDDIATTLEQPDHAFGPALCILAQRSAKTAQKKTAQNG